MTPHFSLAEFTASQSATRQGIDNTVPRNLMQNAQETLDMLERIRSHLSEILGRECPVRITSGYRCPQLNRVIGGASSSDHVQAMAADILAPSFGPPAQVAKALIGSLTNLRIGQLILEYPASAGGGWVHVSGKLPEKPVNRVLTKTARGYELGLKA